MNNPVVWFEIYVQNLADARKFYEAVFQVQLNKLEAAGMELWAFPMKENGAGATGAIMHMDGVPSGGNSTLVYFGCDDCAVEAGRVEKAGGKVIRPKFSIGQFGFIALAADPEGNMIGLHSMK